MGFLPPAAWFQKSGHSSLVTGVYSGDHTWEDLRVAVGDFTDSIFVESRNGMRWRSHAEASLSNFLYARGIGHRRGERYPEAYAEQSGRAYGIYDLHVATTSGWLDVEVWGDRPNGHDEESYAQKRRAKEAFNAGNAAFLGIAHQDCYSDERLAAVLVPYIGSIAPFVFDKPTDRVIQSAHWSNTDELLDFCRKLAAQMPDGRFPTEGWLRKRGKWSDREGPVYNTASVYVKTWLGGVRNVRKLLGQEHLSTTLWDRAAALDAWQQFWQMHGLTPSQYRAAARDETKTIDPAALKEAGRLTHAIVKYAGGAEAANAELGIVIDPAYRWPRDRIVEELRQAVERWGASPHQVVYEHRTGKTVVDLEEFRRLGRLIDAASRSGGLAGFYAEVGYTPSMRPRRSRRRSGE
ncbi:MAG TPA: hypothetical protein VG900_01130 [Hyphomicrobiaceae bacterium]|nr:hypothetical protein [Hyphomicrobiaceae bacterium]